jgi:hypothetical protein
MKEINNVFLVFKKALTFLQDRMKQVWRNAVSSL